jgi:hypothetical protein
VGLSRVLNRGVCRKHGRARRRSTARRAFFGLDWGVSTYSPKGADVALLCNAEVKNADGNRAFAALMNALLKAILPDPK